MGPWGLCHGCERFPNALLGAVDPRLGPNQQKGVEQPAGARPEEEESGRGREGRGVAGLAGPSWRGGG